MRIADDRCDRGFTLVEVVIAIVLVGILSAVVVVGVGQLTTRGTTAACSASADAARAAATTHLGATGSYPTTFTEMTGATPPTLTLPAGATIDATGRIATVSSWTLTLGPGSGTRPPRFGCDLPAGFSVGPNGNYYAFIASAATWAQAATEAATYGTDGRVAHLATITSAAEQSFVFGLVGNSNSAWLGGSYAVAAGTWRWNGGADDGLVFTNGTTPAAGSYTNWGTGEPNGTTFDQCLQFRASTNGRWNDHFCTWTGGQGYVAEIQN